MIHAGELPAVRCGHAYRIPEGATPTPRPRPLARPPVLLTAGEAAARLGTDVETVRQLLRDDDLLACRVGRAIIRVDAASVDRYLAHRAAERKAS